jgi:iron complex outermembrane receptor protein
VGRKTSAQAAYLIQLEETMHIAHTTASSDGGLKKTSWLVGLILLLVGLSPQTFAATNDSDVIEEVIVTGSYIKGSPEDAELPIDVISSEDLLKTGSPSIVDMIRNLGVTTANLGETNQFTSGGQANEGVATVNLRGLGSSRTLVLINGRRHVSDEIVGVDIAAIPKSAIGRIEILKDGAAAVYGSDAIGGVVNFIMREDFKGFEIGGSFQHIDDSDGDWDINGIWGTGGDNWSWTIAAEYAERGELGIRERDWALVNTDRNSPGGWSGIGNPANGRFLVPVAAGNADFEVTDAAGNTTVQNLNYGASTLTKGYVDPQCAALGALRAFEQSCGFNYAYFDNLTEETETINVYTAFNMDLSDNHRLHFEALYSEVDIPAWKTSPSYPPQSLFGPDRVIPADHPGLVDFNNHYGFTSLGGVAAVTRADVIGLADTGGLAAGSSVTGFVPGDGGAAALAGAPSAISINRAFGVQGAFGTGLAESAQRVTETERYVIGLEGVLFNDELNYDISISYSNRDRFIGGQDMYVERMGLALRGYGGPNCSLPAVTQNGDGTYSLAPGATAPGTNGCEYYNPFSRAIAFSAVNGATNPDYNANVANSDELSRWLIGERGWTRENELLVFQAVFSGETSLEFDGGTVGYALGLQARDEEYTSDFWDIADRAVNPCPYTLPVSAALGLVSADQLSPNCIAQTGVAAFLAASDEEQTERTVYSIFGELAIPLTDDVDIQAALRFEDYGGNVGNSLDPKIAVNWRITDEWSLRGSASTTFRGPPQSILGGTGTALSFVGPTGAFKAIDTVGNPNLSSESAVSTNFGVIYQNDTLYASLDWWAFAFEDSFQTESFNDIVGAYSANSCTGANGVPTDSAVCNELRTHLFPVAAHTNLASVERIVVNWINGQDIDTSGIDLSIKYQFAEAYNGVFAVGFDGTYLLEYDRADQLDISGNVTLAPGGDLAGFLNYNEGPSFTSKPEIQANASLTFENDAHYAGLILRHVGSYDDAGAPARLANLSTIDSHTTFDGHYVYRGLEDWTMSLSIVNIADEDPPEARGDLAYDPFTHNPFGRLIKVGVTYTLPE